MDAEAQFRAVTQGTIDRIGETDLRERLAAGRPLRVKLGLDPTASDLHLGHAVVLRTLRRFQDCGHIAVLILGDFTALVGDPSQRSATRPMLSPEQVDEASATYVDQLTAILDPSPERLEVRRNSEWLATMDMGDVLRLTAAMTVAQMLDRNDFAKRYREGSAISISEFLYPLMQGWDSVVVRADVELGGTDQLFNLLVGRALQQAHDQPQQCVLTTPLLVGTSGAREVAPATWPKMSKSLGNCVGVAEPANEQFGKLMSIPDELLAHYFQYATAWDQARVDETIAAIGNGVLHPNAAKRALAAAVCDLYHGAGAGAAAEVEFDRVHKQREQPSEIAEFVLPTGLGPTRLSKILALAELAGSGREAVRLINEGAVRLDDVVVTSDDEVEPSQLAGRVAQVGRRRWARFAQQ